MRKIPLFLTLLLTVFIVPSIGAHAVERLVWDDLSPKMDESKDPFKALSFEQQASLQDVYWIREGKRQGRPTSDSIEKVAQEARKFLQDEGLNVEDLLAKIDAFQELVRHTQNSPVKRLDGQMVRLPGYVLPLESEGNRITEFLLVPFVGACIHTPPPPPNQIVHVRSQDGIEINGIYEAVWVTGQMRIDRREQSLYLVDGTTDFEVSYAIQATQVEPLEQ